MTNDTTFEISYRVADSDRMFYVVTVAYQGEIVAAWRTYTRT